jgi:exopolysaccharide production protein ExoZ
MGTLVSVQLLRAIAALAVAIWHLAWVARAFPGYAPALPPWLAFGYAGVDLFFVISGFIISYVAAGGIRAGAFATRRFQRIVPFYVFFTSLALAAVVLNPAWDGNGNLEPGYILRSLLVFPMPEAPYLGVGWSLEHELVFYCLAGALLAAGAFAHLPALLGGSFCVGIALHGFGVEHGVRIWDFHLFSLYHFEFLVGVLVYRWRDRLAVLGWAAPLLIGALAFSATALWLGFRFESGHLPIQALGWTGLVRVLGYGTASGLVLVGALNAEPRLRRHPRSLAPWVRVGEASFVLYLSHFFVYSILAKLLPLLALPEEVAAIALSAALLLSVAFALAFHLGVERPFLAWARRRRSSPPSGREVATAAPEHP